MLEQRIGPLDISKVINESKIMNTNIEHSMTQGSMMNEDQNAAKKVCYYDKLVDVGDGRLYKGEWLANKSDV